MVIAADTATMELLLITFLILVGPLAILFGSDSRNLDTRDSSRWI